MTAAAAAGLPGGAAPCFARAPTLRLLIAYDREELAACRLTDEPRRRARSGQPLRRGAASPDERGARHKGKARRNGRPDRCWAAGAPCNRRGAWRVRVRCQRLIRVGVGLGFVLGFGFGLGLGLGLVHCPRLVVLPGPRTTGPVGELRHRRSSPRQAEAGLRGGDPHGCSGPRPRRLGAPGRMRRGAHGCCCCWRCSRRRRARVLRGAAGAPTVDSRASEG